MDEFQKKIYFDEINRLTKHHYLKCNNYKKILKNLRYNSNKKYLIEDLPFIPARLFKEIELKSIKKEKVFKVLTSSGTSGTSPSKIFLDKKNAFDQRLILSKIFQKFVGRERLPMLIIGKKLGIEKQKFNAKTAAVLGFSIFGKSINYALNDSGDINYRVLSKFINDYGKQKFFIFGFTSEVYDFFFKKLKLNNGTLIHGGGWKKMESVKVSNEIFKKKFDTKYNLQKVINYYGLIEQVGSIFFECSKCNVFICSDYSDILIRDKNLKILKKGRGFVQLFSLLPTSYPGHNILTEDIGEIVSHEGCKCGFKGKSFKIYGRVVESEVRGCSDV